MDKRILTSRKINTADYENLPDSWYAPQRYFEKFTSVKAVNLTNTMSSAGDWQGYIIQKIGKQFHIIPFYQENNYPYKGFTAYTLDYPIISFRGEMTEDEINQIIREAYNG